MINDNVNKKNAMYVKKSYIWSSSTCSCKNRKQLASIMDDLSITRDEVIESQNEETNLNENKAIYKTQYILLAFLLITIALLIALTIFC